MLRGLQATRPDVAVDVLVARKQAELAAVQAQARGLLEELPRDQGAEPQDYLEIVRGREAVAHRFLQLEQTTQVDLLVLDRPPYAQEVTEPNQGELDLLGRGVRCRGIYAPEAIEQPASLRVLQQAVEAGEEARVHPNLPLKLAISDPLCRPVAPDCGSTAVGWVAAGPADAVAGETPTSTAVAAARGRGQV